MCALLRSVIGLPGWLVSPSWAATPNACSERLGKGGGEELLFVRGGGAAAGLPPFFPKPVVAQGTEEIEESRLVVASKDHAGETALQGVRQPRLG